MLLLLFQSFDSIEDVFWMSRVWWGLFSRTVAIGSFVAGHWFKGVNKVIKALEYFYDKWKIELYYIYQLHRLNGLKSITSNYINVLFEYQFKRISNLKELPLFFLIANLGINLSLCSLISSCGSDSVVGTAQDQGWFFSWRLLRDHLLDQIVPVVNL